MQIFLTPPLTGKAGVSKMARVPEGEMFLPTTPALWVKNFIHLNLKQFKTVHNRIQVRTDTTGTVWYLTDTQIQSININFSCPVSVQRSLYARGGKKRRFFPHTEIGTESKGQEVSGFPNICCILVCHRSFNMLLRCCVSQR